jgi:hypothetical protein
MNAPIAEQFHFHRARKTRLVDAVIRHWANPSPHCLTLCGFEDMRGGAS